MYAFPFFRVCAALAPLRRVNTYTGIALMHIRHIREAAHDPTLSLRGSQAAAVDASRIFSGGGVRKRTPLAPTVRTLRDGVLAGGAR